MANVHGRFAASHVSTEVVTAAREASPMWRRLIGNVRRRCRTLLNQAIGVGGSRWC
jgi:hypothetical protein